MLIAGFAVFALGLGATVTVLTRSQDSGTHAANGVDVLFAVHPVPAGTAASVALAQGLVTRRHVADQVAPAGALTEPVQLSGRVAVSAIPEGQVITDGLFGLPQTRIGTVRIPAGKRALSLQLESVPGVAGFVGAGDLIDVYGVVKADLGASAAVRLVLPSVEVLNVNGTGLPSAQGQPGAPALVYLLAVTPVQAERLIYLTEFAKLYFDLVPKDESPAATPGIGPAQALQNL